MSPAPSPQSIVIIGGGIQGVCTAYYLSQLAKDRARSIAVTILEGSEIAAGASGKAGGLLALDWHGAPTSSLAALSYKLHADLAETYSGATAWGYRGLDTLSVSADLTSTNRPSSNKRSSSSKGLFDWLSQDALCDTSVLGTTRSTAQVHPRLFTQRMAEIAQEQGNVKVVHGTATSLERSSSDNKFIIKASPRDSGGQEITLEVEGVVITAGPWTGSLLSKLGIKAGGRARRIDGSRAHSVVIRTADSRPLPAQALFTSIKERGSMSEPEIYNRPDGTAYACGPTDSSPLPPLASDVKVDGSATSLIVSQVAGLAPDYLAVNDSPHSAKIETEQACYLPVGSGDPVIGKVEEGIWVGSGHSCWGITNGEPTSSTFVHSNLDANPERVLGVQGLRRAYALLS